MDSIPLNLMVRIFNSVRAEVYSALVFMVKEKCELLYFNYNHSITPIRCLTLSFSIKMDLMLEFIVFSFLQD